MGTVQIDGSTPKITVGNATAEDATILFDGNAQDFYIALDDSADDLVIGLGSTIGTTPIFSLTEAGAVTMKNVGTGDDNPMVLTLQTSEADMAQDDVIGKIAFQAPDEGTGTDAILVSAAIQARAEGDHSSSSNATSIDFLTGASEVAAKKLSITSAGHFIPGADNTYDIGTSSLEFKDGYFDGTLHCDIIDLAGTEYTSIGGADPASADGDTLGTASLEWSDLFLADSSVIYFGNDQDVTLTHDPDDGLFLKSIATADNNPVLLTLQTGETDMAADDVIGKIAFQAPDEGTGTDAILVSAAIQAVAEGDHSSSSNATSLQFMTGASEAAAEKMRIASTGNVGIGVSDPDAKLELNGKFKIETSLSGDNIMTVTNSASDGYGPFFKSGGGTTGQFLFKLLTYGGTEKFRVTGDGDVGISTDVPQYMLDVDGNIGYYGSITDYSRRRLKEDIEEIDGSGFIDKFKNIPLYRYRYKPKVEKEELKDLAFREFGTKVSDAVEAVDEVLWAEVDELPEGIEIGDVKIEAVKVQEETWEWDEWDEIFPNGHGQSRMWDCSNPELKTFLDEKAEELRAERRTDYHQKQQLHFGLIADDEALAENFPEVLGYREFNEDGIVNDVWGIKPPSYIGMLHGVIKELVQRVEALEG